MALIPTKQVSEQVANRLVQFAIMDMISTLSRGMVHYNWATGLKTIIINIIFQDSKILRRVHLVLFPLTVAQILHV